MLRSPLAIVAVLSLASSAVAQCLDWQAFPRTDPEWGGRSWAMLVHDDGSGSALYVGGDYSGPNGQDNSVRRWQASTWSTVGDIGGTVYDLATFDDGSGTALYAAGRFAVAPVSSLTNQVARWNGTSWQSVGHFTGPAQTLEVFDDGSGPALFVGGSFGGLTGGPIAPDIARWSGGVWTSLGGGIGISPGDTRVFDLAVHDDGSGAQLYVGGRFATVDGSLVSAQHVARWNGSAWSALPGETLNSWVRSLASYDDGNGAALYIGGTFTAPHPTPRGAVRWTGSSFVSIMPNAGMHVSMLAVLDDGTGPQLYIGAAGASSESPTQSFRYDGTQLTDIGLEGGTNCNTNIGGAVLDFAIYDEGAGPRVFAAGENGLEEADAAVVRWDGGGDWSRLGPTPRGLTGDVTSLCVHDDGSGAALYVGGGFCRADGDWVVGLARWDGSALTSAGMPGYFTNRVTALVEHDDGNGAALYAAADTGGNFSRISRMSGGAWTSIGLSEWGKVYALASFDSGTGPMLYAGGSFTTFGPASPNVVAWDGSAWQSVASGVDADVRDLVVHDDGSGAALYVAGSITSASGVPVHKIARWNGTTFSAVGGGLSADCWALVEFDDGNGPALYAGGDFLSAGGNPARRVARWDGSSWSAVGQGLDSLVTELAVFDDGSGPKLYAAGTFESSQGVTMRRVARWNGVTWNALGGGLGGATQALRSFDDGTGVGAKLFVGGSFAGTPLAASPGLAAWRGCAGEITRFCFGDGTFAACPCSNHGLPSRGCDNSQNTGGARLNATGTTNPDTIVLHAAGELPNAATLVFQGDVVLTAPIAFGDGLRCAGGALKRLYTTQASGGSVTVPPLGGLSISARSAALGDTLVPGTVRAYQTWYRDSNPTFCASPSGNAWNLSNAVRIVW